MVLSKKLSTGMDNINVDIEGQHKKRLKKSASSRWDKKARRRLSKGSWNNPLVIVVLFIAAYIFVWQTVEDVLDSKSLEAANHGGRYGFYVQSELRSFDTIEHEHSKTVFRKQARPDVNNGNVEFHSSASTKDIMDMRDHLYKWNVTLLADENPVRVWSLSDRALEDREKCTNRVKDKFTLVVNTYGQFDLRGTNAALINTISRYIRALHSRLDRVIISWNPTYEDAEKILQALPVDVPVELVLHNTNELGNRFAFGDYICTDHVLHLDNDILVDGSVLLSAYEMFRNGQVSDRLLSLFCASYEKNKDGTFTYQSKGVEKTLRKDKTMCKLGLTGVAFLDKKYHALYHGPEYSELRENIVEKYFSGEDILMNFVVAKELIAKKDSSMLDTKNKVFARLPLTMSSAALKPTVYNVKLGSAIHFAPRKCFNGLAQAEIKFGHDSRKSGPLWKRPDPKINGKVRKRRDIIVESMIQHFGDITKTSARNMCVNYYL